MFSEQSLALSYYTVSFHFERADISLILNFSKIILYLKRRNVYLNIDWSLLLLIANFHQSRRLIRFIVPVSLSLNTCTLYLLFVFVSLLLVLSEFGNSTLINVISYKIKKSIRYLPVVSMSIGCKKIFSPE